MPASTALAKNLLHNHAAALVVGLGVDRFEYLLATGRVGLAVEAYQPEVKPVEVVVLGHFEGNCAERIGNIEVIHQIVVDGQYLLGNLGREVGKDMIFHEVDIPPGLLVGKVASGIGATATGPAAVKSRRS